MRERIRTWFSAPLVVVTAGCSSSSSSPPADDIASYDRIQAVASACVLYESFGCPKDVPCNPPPPRGIECPPEMGTATEARIGPGKPSDDHCLLYLAPCTTRSCGIPTPCLRDNFAPLAPLAWTITPGSDGRCIATPRPRTMFDGGAPVLPVACAGGVIERANARAPCVVCNKSPCAMNSPEIACPDLAP